MNQSKHNLIVVLGPTATGKTALAARLAYELNSAVLSADSRQVYRHMDIGTGKDYGDYIVDGRDVPVHLIDLVEPGYKYNVFEYQQDFLKAYNALRKNDKTPVLCGGSGMYIEAVTKNYELISVPVNQTLRNELLQKNNQELVDILQSYRDLHNTTDTASRKRLVRAIEIAIYQKENPGNQINYPDIKPLYLGICFNRNERRNRITNRLYNRLNNGMVKEVEKLLESGVNAEDLIFYGLEYKYITLYLTNQLSYDEMTSKLNIAIHQFAKRQMTWFRRMERHGDTIHWIDGHLPTEQKMEKAMGIMRAGISV